MTRTARQNKKTKPGEHTRYVNSLTDFSETVRNPSRRSKKRALIVCMLREGQGGVQVGGRGLQT